jgi:hypothetical protein
VIILLQKSAINRRERKEHREIAAKRCKRQKTIHPQIAQITIPDGIKEYGSHLSNERSFCVICG